MNNNILAAFLLFATSLIPLSAQQLRWGDQGNGRYRNPILNADYSDPDAIRVGKKYYMVASDFHFIGMQILESADLVNWNIVTQVYHRFDYPGWDANRHYAGGSWAPAIRYHDGRFWIYFCTPDEGLFMTQAKKPEGPWSPLHLVKAVQKWEDPCPFWDDDGQAYLGRSKHGAGPIIIHKMSPDGRTLLDDGVTVYEGPVAEGTKFLKRDGWYYISIPEGGVEGGWQTVLRSQNIYGPYEKRVVLEQGTTAVNGPHQGALVDAADGRWWFLHFQHAGAIGRIVHLQPVVWHDGWPQIGVDLDGNGVGEPVEEWEMPSGKSAPRLPATSDEFKSKRLSPQWQWNHNPDDTAWSLSEHRGSLTLHTLPANHLMMARNTLTQKAMGYESEVTVAIDVSHIVDGTRCGLACMGMMTETLGVTSADGQRRICHAGAWGTEEAVSQPLPTDTVYLRLTLNIPAKSYQFAYSIDGTTFTPAGRPFVIDFGNWKGVRFAIYNYNTQGLAEGYITVPWLHYDIMR
ncbi:MAG: glycoside hydrolase 43 family protein [Bacteroidaceae bacterium]|nr:glycoside hydrolase 43 family protein [Bacteroidaceae bacterium]